MKLWKLSALILLVGLLGSCATTFPMHFGQYKTLAYGGLLFDKKGYTVSSISVRPADQVIGFSTAFEMIGDNEFIAHGWKPGKYYIESITFGVPKGMFGMTQLEKIYFSGDARLFFDIKENSITNIVSYHCEIVSQFLMSDELNILGKGPDVDKLLLTDLVKKSKGGQWEPILSDYLSKKYPAETTESPNTAL